MHTITDNETVLLDHPTSSSELGYPPPLRAGDSLHLHTAGFGCHAHIATQQTEKEIKDVLATVLRPNNSASDTRAQVARDE